MTETGITPAVFTNISTLRKSDIANAVTAKKTTAILEWIKKENLTPSSVLIFGVYLTGAALASKLCTAANVTVIDIYPHLAALLDCRIDFFTSVTETGREHWDIIIDTTGLGGVDEETLSRISCEALIVEDPCSDASDGCIRFASVRSEILERHPALKKGFLTTSGISTKTSGTMTLTITVSSRAASEAERLSGTLYAVSSGGFPEQILFKEQNLMKYQSVMNQPALFISSLKPVDADALLQGYLSQIHAVVRSVT